MGRPRKQPNPKGSIKPHPSFLEPTFSPSKYQKQENEKNGSLDKPFKCCSCGTRYKRQDGNFPFSQSVFFAGNNNFLPICKNCINNFTDQYTEKLHSQDEAIKRIALHWDMYVSDSLLQSSRKTGAKYSRVMGYVKNCNLTQNAGKTYDTYLSEQLGESIQSYEHFEELKKQGEISISNATVERWGLGFSDDDYKLLDEHYKMLKKYNPNCENNQEIFIKDLCYTKLQQMKALRNNDLDAFDKATKLYRDTFKQTGLRAVDEVDNSNEETFGVTLSVISQYTPEEYYKDKKLYKDFDGIGEYIKRFITRPLKNLQFGTKDRDEEFCVSGGSDEE